jgi:hypothetical protein
MSQYSGSLENNIIYPLNKSVNVLIYHTRHNGLHISFITMNDVNMWANGKVDQEDGTECIFQLKYPSDAKVIYIPSYTDLMDNERHYSYNISAMGLATVDAQINPNTNNDIKIYTSHIKTGNFHSLELASS